MKVYWYDSYPSRGFEKTFQTAVVVLTTGFGLGINHGACLMLVGAFLDNRRNIEVLKEIV